MNPKISVIMPYSDNAPALPESIVSILTQDFQDFELLLIDNNSTDECHEIATKYSNQDPRVKIVSMEEPGIVNALNEGIGISTGKYLAVMDQKDISDPQRLSLQYRFLEENPEYGLAASCVRYIHDAEMQYDSYEYVNRINQLITDTDIRINLFIESPLVHSTVMFRSELPGEHGAYRLGDFPEDYELWLRWIDRGVRMHKLKEQLLGWRDSSVRQFHNEERYSVGSFFELKTVYLYKWLRENNPWHPHIVVWGAGRLSRQRFALLNELGIDPKFFIDLHENRNRNVIEQTRTPPAGRHFIVNYVTSPDARSKIRDFLFQLGYIEGKDFICIS